MSARAGRVVGAVLCCVVVLVGAACSSDSASTSTGGPGDKTAFCTTMGELRPLLQSTVAGEFRTMLTSKQEAFKSLETTAPSEVRNDARLVIAVVAKVVSTGELAPFLNPRSMNYKAIAHIDTFCGVDPVTAVSVLTNDAGASSSS
ncbi:MAG: hypothetical protein QOI95_3720 [Acidimicrobiaceae bacterium]|jgi:hypothetical protein